jgi:hypothetical protein
MPVCRELGSHCFAFDPAGLRTWLGCRPAGRPRPLTVPIAPLLGAFLFSFFPVTPFLVIVFSECQNGSDKNLSLPCSLM